MRRSGPVTRIPSQAATLAASAEMTPPVRLVVLDSIASPFRDLDADCADEMAHRSATLHRVACALKELAHRYAERGFKDAHRRCDASRVRCVHATVLTCAS